jgi:hypothetical protein
MSIRQCLAVFWLVPAMSLAAFGVIMSSRTRRLG